MEPMRLNLSHVGAAAEAWGLAFPPGGNGNIIPRMWEVLLRLKIRHGEVYATSPAFEGVAAWLRPGLVYPTTLQIITSAPLDLAVFLWSGGRSVVAQYRFQEGMQKRNAPMPHWHLGPIAVVPHHQGQGFASKLMRPMLARADAEGMPVYLDANNDVHISLYEHFGFEVQERLDMSGGGFWNASMLRIPRA
jgi:ribosomal protein S18 acetylase RimI-like enzyme